MINVILFGLLAVTAFADVVNESCSGDQVMVNAGVCVAGDNGDSTMITCTSSGATMMWDEDNEDCSNLSDDGSMETGVCKEMWGWAGFNATLVSCDGTTAVFEFCLDTATNVCATSDDERDGCTPCRCEDYCCNTQSTSHYGYSMWSMWENECSCGSESELNQRIADFDAEWCTDPDGNVWPGCEPLPSTVAMCGGDDDMDANTDDESADEACDSQSEAYMTCMFANNGADCSNLFDELILCGATEEDIIDECMGDYSDVMACIYDYYVTEALAGNTIDDDDETYLLDCEDEIMDYNFCMMADGDADCSQCFSDNSECFDYANEMDVDCSCVCTACITDCGAVLAVDGITTADECVMFCEADDSSMEDDCLNDCWECQDNLDVCLWSFDSSQDENFDTFDCDIACVNVEDCLNDCWECQDNLDVCLWSFDSSQDENFDTFDCDIACGNDDDESADEPCDSQSLDYMTCMLADDGADCSNLFDAMVQCTAGEEDPDVLDECMADYSDAMACIYDYYVAQSLAGNFVDDDDDTYMLLCEDEITDYQFCDMADGDADCSQCFSDNTECFDYANDMDVDCSCVCTACITDCAAVLAVDGITTADECVIMCEEDGSEYSGDGCDEQSSDYIMCLMTADEDADCDDLLDSMLACSAADEDVSTECMGDYSDVMSCFYQNYLTASLAGNGEPDEDLIMAQCDTELEDWAICELAPGDADCQTCFADNANCFGDDDEETDCDCLCSACLDDCDKTLGEMCIETKAQCMVMCESDDDDWTLCTNGADTESEDSVFALASLVVFAAVAIFF